MGRAGEVEWNIAVRERVDPGGVELTCRGTLAGAGD
jgi:hypothetical protein